MFSARVKPDRRAFSRSAVERAFLLAASAAAGSLVPTARQQASRISAASRYASPSSRSWSARFASVPVVPSCASVLLTDSTCAIMPDSASNNRPPAGTMSAHAFWNALVASWYTSADSLYFRYVAFACSRSARSVVSSGCSRLKPSIAVLAASVSSSFLLAACQVASEGALS
jgi:hypothetical protein